MGRKFDRNMNQISESVRIGRHGENNWPGPYMGMARGCAWLPRQRIFAGVAGEFATA
jgi:hypothetical protein